MATLIQMLGIIILILPDLFYATSLSGGGDGNAVGMSKLEPFSSDSENEYNDPFWVPPETAAPRRVIETYTDRVRAFIGLDAWMKLMTQMEADKINDRFTPNITVDNHTEMTPFGLFNLTRIVHQGYDSVIFEIENNENILIKYQLHCVDFEMDIHPLLRDHWYMGEANNSGLAPRPLFLSPPGRVCEHHTGKCAFIRMPIAELRECHQTGGVARYMIMERVKGMTLHEVRTSAYGSPSGAMSLISSFRIVIAVLSSLAKLHNQAKVVHGDIHTGNIVYDETNKKIIFIDFGRAFRKTEAPEYQIYKLGVHREYMHSLWQIEGFAWAARDDIIKTIHMLAFLMHPFQYADMEFGIQLRGLYTLHEWKQRGDWFRYRAFDPIEALTTTVSQPSQVLIDSQISIRESLSKILRIARSLQINQQIPYGLLLEELRKCVEAASRAQEEIVRLMESK